MKYPLLIKNDPWLEPFTETILRRQANALLKKENLTQERTLADFATGYLYFGLHSNEEGWVIREWAPHASMIYLYGTFNDWQIDEGYKFNPLGNGVWELQLPPEKLHQGDLYALMVYWPGGSGKRIPAWAWRTIQDEKTYIFNAQVWFPENPYTWKHPQLQRKDEPLLIYEAHIGMAGEEHPYYGSFGYHVSSFFAPSSRFGTPDELKELVDDAHGMGIAVIMDLVHSHAVRNEIEGLGKYDGTRYQFFHDGSRGEHPAWDSYCFNYNKNEVLHFLLSNIKYWLDVYKFDGFRFDGVTSMLYFDHGLGKAFTSYNDYFDANCDEEAVTYFLLANQLIKEVNPHSISIAEDMSGMPGLAVPVANGGMGFDYRLAMGVPDYWIKIIKEKKDDEWQMGDIFYQLTSKRMDEKVVSYAESHDQALVGDKTIIFRLIDKEMYFSMRNSCAGGAYLNFMGNEFGHPEWIDFPREGNNWSYRHARRIWSIATNPELKYHWLLDFDYDMVQLIRKNQILGIPPVHLVWEKDNDQVLAYHRGQWLFVFNFNSEKSFTDYGIPLGAGKYKVALSSDNGRYGGQDRIDESLTYYTLPAGEKESQHYLRLYLPARTAVVMLREEIRKVN